VAGALLALAACSRGADQTGAASPEEASQLNDAAAMLDANSVDADALSANHLETP